WQRLALRIYARYQGRERAAAHADALVKLLKSELGVDPEPETLKAIDSIGKNSISKNAISRAHAVAPGETAPRDRQSAPVVDLMEDVEERRTWIALVSRAYEHAAGWSLGTVSSILVAALIGLSATALLLSDQRMSPRSDSAEASTRHRSVANGTGSAMKPVAPLGLVPIVVLPFTADDGADGPNQRAADALTDDLINTLSRFAVTRVISRQTAFTYKGHSIDVADVGAELRVRYAVEGSLRKV